MKYYKHFSLGCKVNTYETEAVCRILDRHGYTESEDDRCDLIVINTCAVTLTGESKSRQKIRSLKKRYPSAEIFVMGCYSQLHPDQVASIEGVDVVVGTSSRTRIIELLEEARKSKKTIVEVEKNLFHRTYECLEIDSYRENTRAFVKIQDGCSNFCSYCVIPYTRGNIRSRKEEDILEEVGRLVNNGYSEIVLTGIDMASYGKDFGEKTTLNRLIRSILSSVPELKRLRISSLEAGQIDDEFIELLKTYPAIARHLHIPLQSGSEKILRKMNRKYTKETFYSDLKKIREAVPDIALACDVIVGFPGEGEKEFEETCDFIRRCGFDYLHVFPYSPRPSTPAASMPDQVPDSIKKQRVSRLIALGRQLKEEYENRFIGKEVDVIVETYDREKRLCRGYSSNYLEVSFQSETDLRGKYIKAIYEKEVRT